MKLTLFSRLDPDANRKYEAAPQPKLIADPQRADI
jgi:hypothetical protein